MARANTKKRAKPVRRLKKPTKLASTTTRTSAAGANKKTKADRVVALLKRPAGATLEAIMGATGWQAHSVRGFISGHLIKKLGFKVESYRRDGERVYAIKQ